MSTAVKSVVSATALAFALLASPGPALARSSDTDCVRRVAPPSPNPHDVFRRIVCVPREDAAGTFEACREPCRTVADPQRPPGAPSYAASGPRQGAEG